MRKLGIPTVLDRFIQQAVMQVLQKQWDRTFSGHSYGFRPGHSAHHAVAQAAQYIVGHRWCVDLDLEKFFDNIPQDLLVRAVKKQAKEQWVILDIERWLKAPVQEEDGPGAKRFVQELSIITNSLSCRRPCEFSPRQVNRQSTLP